MWDIFEHFRFIKNLFDFDCPTGKVSIVLSAIINIFSVAMGWFHYFIDNILGISLLFAVMVFIIMFMDLCTGLAASKREKKQIESKKGTRWIIKFGAYVTFIAILQTFTIESALNGFDWVTYPLNIIKFYLMIHIVLCETKSIDENLQRLGYHMDIFKFVENIFMDISKLFSKRINIGGKK